MATVNQLVFVSSNGIIPTFSNLEKIKDIDASYNNTAISAIGSIEYPNLGYVVTGEISTAKSIFRVYGCIIDPENQFAAAVTELSYYEYTDAEARYLTNVICVKEDEGPEVLYFGFKSAPDTDNQIKIMKFNTRTETFLEHSTITETTADMVGTPELFYYNDILYCMTRENEEGSSHPRLALFHYDGNSNWYTNYNMPKVEAIGAFNVIVYQGYVYVFHYTLGSTLTYKRSDMQLWEEGKSFTSLPNLDGYPTIHNGYVRIVYFNGDNQCLDFGFDGNQVILRADRPFSYPFSSLKVKAIATLGLGNRLLIPMVISIDR